MATSQPIALELLPSSSDSKPGAADKKKKRAIFSPQRIKTRLHIGPSKSPSPSPKRVVETYSAIPLYLCFHEEAHMQELLAELEQKDLQAWSQFDSRHYPPPPPPAPPTTTRRRTDSFELSLETSVSPPPPTSSSYIDSFISLLLQSSFEGRLETDAHNIILTLIHSQQCPDLPIFRRVCIEPSLVANDVPEIDNPGLHRGIPVNQLARYCDVAVVRFLSTVTEHTQNQAVMCALQYVQNLLNSLITSLNTLSTFGWYGAPPMRIRKGTTTSRHSVTHPPPNLAALQQQHQQQSSTLPEVNIVAGTPPTSPQRTRGNLESFLDPETGQRSPIPSPPSVPSSSAPGRSQDDTRARSQTSGAVEEGGGRQRRTSRQEPNSQLNAFPSHSGRSQTHSQGGMLHSPRSKRGLSPPSVASIPEETDSSAPRGRSRSPEFTQFEMDGDDDMARSPSNYSSRLSTRSEILQQSCLGSIEEEEDGGPATEPPPPPSRSHRPLSFSEHSDTDEDDVRSKLPSQKPSEATDIPQVDVAKELETFITAEGRISLLAILRAISNLPQNPDLWGNDLGLKCFSVIQLCMNLGLVQAEESKPSEAKLSQQDRRQRFRKQGNFAFTKMAKSENPSQVHSKKVVEFATHALIQCAVSVMVGCVSEPNLCRLSHKHLPNQSRFIHDKLIHNLRRIHVHRSSFRQALMEFAQPSGSSCRKLFHFLHVVLQYCHRSREGAVDSLLAAIVSAVLRVAVDRLAQLDLAEDTIQNSIVAEACGFFQYAYQLFSTEWVTQTKDFQHLHMYLHRIALSVILPPRPLPSAATTAVETSGLYSPLRGAEAATAGSLSSPPPPNEPMSDTLPRKKHSSNPAASRKRTGSLNLPSSTKVETSPQLPVKHFPGAKPRLSKQPSIHSDGDGDFPEGTEGLSYRRAGRRVGVGSGGGGGEGCQQDVKEWRGLRLGTLRSRIQRLNVLQQTSEPGTVPDPAMLASLIDLCDGMSVVARSMVLLECAMFVSQLRETSSLGQMPTVWLSLNKEGGHAICLHLSRWGEAIGEKLRLSELKEKEALQRLRKSDTNADGAALFLPEEPVFPDVLDTSSGEDGSRDGGKFLAVSYAVKMSACVLLLEITRFLRDPLPQFAGPSISQVSTPRVSITQNPLDRERKPSSSSIVSSDVEGAKGSGSGARVLHPARTGHLGAYGSSLSVEDAEIPPDPYFSKPFSFEDNPPSPRKRRVSFVVRVNSQSAGKAGGHVSSFQKPSAKYEVHSRPVSMAVAPPPVTQQRRISLSASSVGANALQASFHGRPQTATRHRPSFAGGSATLGTFRPLPQRRKSMGSVLSKQSSVNESSSQHRHIPVRSPSPSGPSGKLLGASINQGLSRLKRSAQAFRRKVTRKGGDFTSGLASSPRNSPGLPHRKRTQRLSTTGSFAASVTVPPEDSRRYYPWLDVVEHLILIDAFDAAASQRHKTACKELISALKNVYDTPMPRQQEVGGVQKTGTNLTMSRSLSRIFYHQASAAELQGLSQRKLSHRPSFPSLSSRRKRSSGQKLSTIKLGALPHTHTSSLTFADYSTVHFANCFLGGATSSTSKEGTIELYLEEESAFSTDFLRADGDRLRRNYLLSQYNGLMHTPFSVLVHAAAVLHPQTFTLLKEVAWSVLLDVDQELARAGAAFFLLACAKESPSALERFVKEKVGRSPRRQLEAVLRFQRLWRARYHVWPRMEERKKFKMYSEDDGSDVQSIGYSLPANLLGSAGSEVPLAPWKPASVCRNHSCADNPDKCYRPTQLAPVVHREDIASLSEGYSVTGVSITQEASTKSSNIEYFGVESEDATGNIDFRYEAVDRTFFPLSLMPLIRFMITSLHHPSSSSSTPSPPPPPSQPPTVTHLDVSEQAREVVWTCMIEDPRIFFRPLLNQFNRLYKVITASKSKRDTRSTNILTDLLQQMHTVLQVFPSLPPNAAHLLFNNFVGVIMRHTDQPCTSSAKIIQSVLTLIGMVVPSVQGLDCKVLKGILKKESCYTTIMTTARIRGAEKVYLALPNHAPHDRKLYEVAEDMNFGQLIASAQDDRHLMVHDPGAYYLVDEGKDLPVLSCLTVQDIYSTPSDGQYPTFLLERVSDSYWPQQMEELFLHKMSEMSRVLFSTQLLLTGPDVEKGLAYSEYAQPNSRFIHSELVELNSFPRKALTSVLYEAGPGALQRVQLKASDVMLKGMWVEFILQLFKSVKPEHDWANGMILFLNVINGSLLLYSEDHTILRLCLASLLTAASKFHGIFKKDGYLMIVPTLIQVYALHMKNKVITNAVKFVWTQFYLLDSNSFLLQAVAASATVLSEEAALLSRNIGTTFTILSQSSNAEGSLAQRNHAKAVFELLEALSAEQLTRDSELDVLSCCPTVLDSEGHAQLTPARWERLKLQNSLSLCVTLATWNPEVLRGMQVLVFLSHLLPLFVEEFGAQSSIMSSSVRYLIKGCEPLSKPSTWRGDILTSRKTAGGGVAKPEAPPTNTGGFPAPSLSGRGEAPKPKPARKTSEAVIRFKNLIINPNRRAERGGGGGGRGRHPDAEGDSLPRPSKPQALLAPPDIVTEFKQRRVQDTNQRVLRLARESLLELSAQFVELFNSSLSAGGGGGEGGRGAAGRRDSVLRPEARAKTALEAQHLMVLTATAVQLLKQGNTTDIALQGKGLNNFMSQLLPKIEWSDTLHFTTFNSLLSRLCKLCRKFQQDTNKALLVRENLATFLTGITMALRKSPQLVINYDQNFSKIKMLLEILVAPPTGGGVAQPAAASAQAQKRKSHFQKHLLDGSPQYFTEAVVALATELIVATHSVPQHRRFHISDLLPQKLLKEHETLTMKTILLPLCIHLGLKENLLDLREDASYALELVERQQKKVFSKSRDQQQQPEPFFRLVKVVCCAFEESFSLQEWHRLASLLSSLAQRKVSTMAAGGGGGGGKKSSLASLSSGEGVEGGRRLLRGSRLPSNASITSVGSGSSPLEGFLTFHEHLLGFFDSFLLSYHTPLYSLLWPLLRQLEQQLQSVMQAVKADNPVLIERLTLCIGRCQSLRAEGGAPSRLLLSRHKVLLDISQELKDLNSLSQTKSLSRSATTVERRSTKKVPKLRTHSVSSPLVKIGEEEEDSDGAQPKAVEPRKSPFQHRPTFIRLRSHKREEATTSPLAVEKREHAREKPRFLGSSPRRQKKATRAAAVRSQDSLDVAESPIIMRRSPKLAEIGRRLGSSECYADDEDVDGYSDDQLSPPDYHVKRGAGYLTPLSGGVPGGAKSPSELVLPNARVLSRSSPLASRPEDSSQLTVSVEVHDFSGPGSTTTHKDSFGESYGQQDTSEMRLLPDPSPPQKGLATSPFSKNNSKSLGDISNGSSSLEARPACGEGGGGGGGRGRKTSKNAGATTPDRKKKISFDRKAVSWKTGLSESTPFIYGNMAEDTSFC